MTRFALTESRALAYPPLETPVLPTGRNAFRPKRNVALKLTGSDQASSRIRLISKPLSSVNALQFVAAFLSSFSRDQTMTHIDLPSNVVANPVDTIEFLAESNDWVFDRSSEDEITISASGYHCDFHVSFTWMEELDGLHLACAFDFKVSERQRGEILELLAAINEQLWIGHLDFWSKEGVVMFRQTMMLAEGGEISSTQVELMLRTAIETCQRYYPAFQFVVWAGKSAKEALEAVLLETVGEA